MCGIIGVVAKSPVNQLLYDGLLVLQHRGQDAAGIVTAEGSTFHMHKGSGLVRDVFRTRDMRNLGGYSGIAHCRYPTAGSANNSAESQPLYVNSPFGVVLGHNGNLTNAEELKRELYRQDLRHVNTNSDSEVLLNVLAHELTASARDHRLDPATIFQAVAGVHLNLDFRCAAVPGEGRVDGNRRAGLQMRLAIGTTFDVPAAKDGFRPDVLQLAIDVGESGDQERAAHDSAIDPGDMHVQRSALCGVSR